MVIRSFPVLPKFRPDAVLPEEVSLCSAAGHIISANGFAYSFMVISIKSLLSIVCLYETSEITPNLVMEIYFYIYTPVVWNEIPEFSVDFQQFSCRYPKTPRDCIIVTALFAKIWSVHKPPFDLQQPKFRNLDRSYLMPAENACEAFVKEDISGRCDMLE